MLAFDMNKPNPIFTWPETDPNTPPQKPEDLDRVARELWEAYLGPFRRPRPRVSTIFQGAEQHMIPTPGGAVAAWRIGEGPAVMMMHGYFDDHTLWTPLIRKLLDEGRSAVAFDLPGHGLSEGDHSTLRYGTDAALAVAKTLGPVEAMVGHSLGGLIVAQACVEGLAVNRAVIIGTTTYRSKRLAGMAAQHGLGADVIERVRELHGEAFGAIDMEGRIPDFVTDDNRGRLPPALFINSTDDEAVPAECSEAGAAIWPDSELLIISGVGHRNSARDPDTLDRIVAFTRA